MLNEKFQRNVAVPLNNVETEALDQWVRVPNCISKGGTLSPKLGFVPVSKEIPIPSLSRGLILLFASVFQSQISKDVVPQNVGANSQRLQGRMTGDAAYLPRLTQPTPGGEQMTLRSILSSSSGSRPVTPSLDSPIESKEDDLDLLAAGDVGGEVEGHHRGRLVGT